MIYPEDAQDSKEVIAVGFHGLPISVDRTSFSNDSITAWNVDHRLVLMQSTEQKDRNGKGIYEDDIIRLWCEKCAQKRMMIVMFNNGGFSFGCHHCQKFGDWLTRHYAEKCEIVGNLYEGKDLIEEALQ